MANEVTPLAGKALQDVSFSFAKPFVFVTLSYDYDVLASGSPTPSTSDRVRAALLGKKAK